MVPEYKKTVMLSARVILSASHTLTMLPINSSGMRARLLYCSMPSRMRPLLRDHRLVCPHGKTRFIDIDIATDRFSDIYAWVHVRHGLSLNFSNSP
jgi:hypothetical protein